MLGDRTKILIETSRRLMRRGATANLKKILNKTHAADLAVLIQNISPSEQKKMFSMIEDPTAKGTVLSMLHEDESSRLIGARPVDELVEIFQTMPSDDAADIIGQLDQDLAETILKKMDKEESEDVTELLGYDDQTAGGIMIPDFVSIRENDTAREIIGSLQQEYKEVEMPFYLYVTDDDGRLVGVSSLRQLVVVPPDTPVGSFMEKDVLDVRTDMDQEEVAKIVARYDILAVPVVDQDRRLVGIVTVDDVIDIFREEATEDILKMAGVGEEFVETQTVLKSTRIRLPWLFASCVGGIIAYFVIEQFQTSLEKVAYLAAFIPVIMGMGGNIGTQSSTIVVRGLATGRIQIGRLWGVVSKELSVGLILGVFYGLVVGAVAQFTHGQSGLAFAVGLAVLSSMSIAALVGSLFPLIFAKLHIDPAVATGPFVTTSIDILSVFLYFQIATMVLFH